MQLRVYPATCCVGAGAPSSTALLPCPLGFMPSAPHPLGKPSLCTGSLFEGWLFSPLCQNQQSPYQQSTPGLPTPAEENYQ